MLPANVMCCHSRPVAQGHAHAGGAGAHLRLTRQYKGQGAPLHCTARRRGSRLLAAGRTAAGLAGAARHMRNRHGGARRNGADQSL